MLEQRVMDLERRVRELEQEKAQSPPGGSKATQSSDQQTYRRRAGSSGGEPAVSVASRERQRSGGVKTARPLLVVE
jgi:hypothetical protein